MTGPEGTSRAIICLYDIFGFYPQTQQGADVLAKTLNAKVVMPDFFEPDPPFPSENYPPANDEQKAQLQAFFGGPAKIDKAVANVQKVGQALKGSGVTQLGVYGLCWGASMWRCAAPRGSH